MEKITRGDIQGRKRSTNRNDTYTRANPESSLDSSFVLPFLLW